MFATCMVARPKALNPQSLQPWCDLSATDFDCDLCNYFSITGIVADQSPTNPHTYSAHLAGGWSATDGSSIGD